MDRDEQIDGFQLHREGCYLKNDMHKCKLCMALTTNWLAH